jgi:hypothetical protein
MWNSFYWTWSIDWEALIKGLPSMKNFDGLVKLDINMYELLVDCSNPDGESPNAEASVHQVQDATVDSTVGSPDWYAVKGGKIQVDGEVITNDAMLSAANLSPGDVCPNDNWQLNLISLTGFDATITLLMGDSGTCDTNDQSGCEEAIVTFYDDCYFSDDPQPNELPVCASITTYSYDWKKAL